jgi:hypothetical protein
LALSLKRNPIIILRKPVSTNINRISSFNHDTVKKYLESQVMVVEKHKIAERKKNYVDET